MATTGITTYPAKGTILLSWPTLSGEVGLALTIDKYPDKTMTVVGAGTVLLEGSHDGISYSTMKDAQGVAITAATAGMYLIGGHTKFIRPTATGAAAVAIMGVATH